MDMFYAGLPTVSNGELLSSEGCFKLEFWIDGVPSYPRRIETKYLAENGISQTMQLFSGKLSESGFDWLESEQELGYAQFDSLPTGFLYLSESSPNFYSSELSNLGSLWEQNGGVTYINCDDFPTVTTSRTDVQFNVLNMPNNVTDSGYGGLYFQELNGFMSIQSSQTPESPRVFNVPTTLECTAMIVVVSDETLYYAIQPIIVTEEIVVDMELAAVSEEELTEILEGL